MQRVQLVKGKISENFSTLFVEGQQPGFFSDSSFLASFKRTFQSLPIQSRGGSCDRYHYSSSSPFLDRRSSPVGYHSTWYPSWWVEASLGTIIYSSCSFSISIKISKSKQNQFLLSPRRLEKKMIIELILEPWKQRLFLLMMVGGFTSCPTLRLRETWTWTWTPTHRTALHINKL